MLQSDRLRRNCVTTPKVHSRAPATQRLINKSLISKSYLIIQQDFPTMALATLHDTDCSNDAYNLVNFEWHDKTIFQR